jgi:ABC-2 type transport system ATP-binding protein
MIELENVSKVYDGKYALRNLSLKIREGEIFGLLGHNGAGKSTTIKSLVSIIEPTEGEIFVDGENLAEHRNEIKRRISYVGDSPDIFLQLTANEYWNLLAAAYGLTEQQKNTQVEKYANLFDIYTVQDEVIESFSHGMRQKVMLVGAMLAEPDIWILDEPMQGLDPQAAFDLKNLMKEHAAKGKTVIFSTHVLNDAQEICDELAILKKGSLIYNGTVDALLEKAGDESLETVYLKMAGRETTTDEALARGVAHE